MSNANPYRAPAAEIADIPQDEEFELAGAGHRFGAFVLDTTIALALLFALAYATGTTDFIWNAVDTLVGAAEITAILFALFVVTQSFFLKRYGQTIGKKIVGIRMVNRDGKVPGLLRLLFLRYLPIHLYNAMAFVGTILATVDFLLIFRRDRRCLHDMIAGTRVVMHGARHSSATWIVAPIVALIGLIIAIAIIGPMLDTPPAKAKHHAHAKKSAGKHQPAARKPAVQTATAHGTAAQIHPAPATAKQTRQAVPEQTAPARTSGQPAVGASSARPARYSVLTQATAPTPAPAAAPTAAALSATAKKQLRHCATLGSAAAIIRCSQRVH